MRRRKKTCINFTFWGTRQNMIMTALRDAFLSLSYKKYLAKSFSEGYELPYAAFVRNSLYICRIEQHICAFLPYYEANKMTTTARSQLSAP